MIARYIGLGLVVGMTCVGAYAQETLSDLVAEANAGWMLGKWEAQIDSGKVTIEFSWDLDKHVIVLHAKTPDMELKGYSARDPGSTMDVNYYGFDNRGTVTKGAWTLEGEDLVLKIESRSSERTVKMGATFSGSATQGLTVRLHGVDSWGNLVTPARTELKLQKVK